MRDPDLAALTVTRLRALAAELGVSLPARPTKTDMIAAIERARGAQAARATRGGAKPKTTASGKAKGAARGKAKGAAGAAKGVAQGKAKGAAGAAKGVALRNARGAERGEGQGRQGTRSGTRVGGHAGTASSLGRGAATAHAARKGAAARPPASADAAPLETPPAAPQLPREYGEDRLVVMPRDPGSAFAYWEVSPDHARDALADAGRDARLALRVYDTRGAALERWRDFDAGERVGRRYLELTGAARDLVAELGALAADGTFVPVARSRAVHLPAAQASQLEDRVFRLFGAIDTPAAWHSGTGLAVAGVLGDSSGLASSAELQAEGLASSAGLVSSGALPSSVGLSASSTLVSSQARSGSPGGS